MANYAYTYTHFVISIWHLLGRFREGRAFAFYRMPCMQCVVRAKRTNKPTHHVRLYSRESKRERMRGSGTAKKKFASPKWGECRANELSRGPRVFVNVSMCAVHTLALYIPAELEYLFSLSLSLSLSVFCTRNGNAGWQMHIRG